MPDSIATLDGNEAVARVAYLLNEVIAIYPITPSSAMGEWADQWAAEGRPNLWGTVPQVVEMQSEGGAAGAVHGALQVGSLTTTFTASQGLLLMIPNMYKIAGELTPAVFHVAARALAAQALSIFGDHSDVMAARSTGFALLASNSVQEAHDFAAIAQAATLEARIPLMHFFDGFRTSHEINKIRLLSNEQLAGLLDSQFIRAHSERALTPDHPSIRGTAQNPDVYFQARETVNSYYLACPAIVQGVMDRFAALTGRGYRLFEYVGVPDAERVVVLMGSAAETMQQTVEHLAGRGEKVGLLKVRLYRPFDGAQFAAALPQTVRSVAVLDRTKEPGSLGEPLYLDVLAALSEAGRRPIVVGGRYGLGSKEFSPAMAKAVLDELARPQPKNHFTVGIEDDLTHTSLAIDPSFELGLGDAVQAVFYGLGADGTVSANKNTITIIGEQTNQYAQGYFVLDSKKAGSRTVSHLRFGSDPIRAPYLIQAADFIACHQFDFIEKFDVLRLAKRGATLLLNCPLRADEVWNQLPRTVQRTILDRQLRFYVIDAEQVAREAGLGPRINTVMQVCFFALTHILPLEEAVESIKRGIEKTYGKRGREVVRRNFNAVEAALKQLQPVAAPDEVTSAFDLQPPVSGLAPDFVRTVIGPMVAGDGDRLPVSALPPDGAYPSGTSKWERRNLAQEIPVWDTGLCIQCGKCVFVCPHAVIRQKLYEPSFLEGAPPAFRSAPARFKEYKELVYTLQVEPEQCTGCALCFEVCPVKDKAEPKRRAINMASQRPLQETERANWDFFVQLPELDRTHLPLNQVKYSQLLQPLFEFSGACAGCGETPYLKLLSQLFGDRALIANATGCSSIYGGNLPTHPWTLNSQGRGPAWSNSLFEDNAEFGLGMRIALDQKLAAARQVLDELRGEIGSELVQALLQADQTDEGLLQAQRERVAALKARLAGLQSEPARRLLDLADWLVQKTVWIVGGDGWAYDIGYGGLDHVLASGRDVNLLVLDTEVYSNTGGQQSKATPRGAVAKFAAAGKPTPKKDLGMMAMTYGSVYVARVAFGADDRQTLRAVLEAQSFGGPSLIIAYSPCIAHAYDLRFGLDQQDRAVRSGYWPLYRFDPRLAARGENPLQLDSRPPSIPLADYLYAEGRFRVLTQSHPQRAVELLRAAEQDVKEHWSRYERLAQPWNGQGPGQPSSEAALAEPVEE